jgi:hypothetical protein
MKYSDFYSKYLVFDDDKTNLKKPILKSLQKIIITNPKELSLYKSDLFSILPKKSVLGVYSNLMDGGGFDFSVIIVKLSSKESYDKVKDKLISYFGIYQKTKNVSSIYLFDDKEFTFVELTSGCLDADDLIKSIADQIVKKLKLKRHDFICDVEFDDDDEYNELID